MDSEISGQVLSATSRVTTNGKTVYDIAFSDGNTYATFKGDLFTKAQGLQGQQASARVSVKQKGEYTNFYLNDIAPAGQLAPPGVTLHQPSAAQPPQPAPAPQGGMSAEREQKIVKQSSFATAFKFVGALYQGANAVGGLTPAEIDDAKKLAHELAAELYGHVMGTQQAAPAEKPAEDPVPW